jgi:hypothetical protein
MTTQFPGSHLAFIQTNFGRPLTVFLPMLYRHMDAKFIEQFSIEGRIRLSCFATFAQHKDEARKDTAEGHGFHVLNDLKNDRSFVAYTMTGSNAYIMSATSRTGPQIVKDFGPNRFEIVEPVGFCAEIANEIPGCQAAMISQCLYADDKILHTAGGRAPISKRRQATAVCRRSARHGEFFRHGSAAAVGRAGALAEPVQRGGREMRSGTSREAVSRPLLEQSRSVKAAISA